MDKKLLGLLITLVLVFSLFISFVVFEKPIQTFTRAADESVPSSEKSLIFAWPLTTKASNREKVMINVFIRNANNRPLPNKAVFINTTLGNVETNPQITDKSGKATFYLTSGDPGLAEVSASVDNQIQIKQKVTIKFE